MAEKASNSDEVPVAAIIMHKDKLIASATNSRYKDGNPLHHAEVKCIIKASKKIGDWRLDDCDMYVTLEPCSMCQAIIEECRIKNIYYLVKSQSILNKKTKYNHVINIYSKEYKQLLKSFFKKIR